jgi:hypothetical protein
LGHSEDYIEVLDRQQLRSTLFEQLRSGLAATLRAMETAARAVSDSSAATLIALVEVTAERRRAADCNRSQRLLLRWLPPPQPTAHTS